MCRWQGQGFIFPKIKCITRNWISILTDFLSEQNVGDVLPKGETKSLFVP